MCIGRLRAAGDATELLLIDAYTQSLTCSHCQRGFKIVGRVSANGRGEALIHEITHVCGWMRDARNARNYHALTIRGGRGDHLARRRVEQFGNKFARQTGRLGVARQSSRRLHLGLELRGDGSKAVFGFRSRDELCSDGLKALLFPGIGPCCRRLCPHLGQRLELWWRRTVDLDDVDVAVARRERIAFFADVRSLELGAKIRRCRQLCLCPGWRQAVCVNRSDMYEPHTRSLGSFRKRCATGAGIIEGVGHVGQFCLRKLGGHILAQLILHICKGLVAARRDSCYAQQYPTEAGFDWLRHAVHRQGKGRRPAVAAKICLYNATKRNVGRFQATLCCDIGEGCSRIDLRARGGGTRPVGKHNLFDVALLRDHILIFFELVLLLQLLICHVDVGRHVLGAGDRIGHVAVFWRAECLRVRFDVFSKLAVVWLRGRAGCALRYDDVVGDTAFVDVIEQQAGVTRRQSNSVMDGVEKLVTREIKAFCLYELLFRVAQALKPKKELIVVERAEGTAKSRDRPDSAGNLGVGGAQTVFGYDLIDRVAVKEGLEGLFVETARACFLRGYVVAGLLGGAAQEVAVVALEIVSRDFLTADRGNACIGIAAKDVGDAPDAKAERESPKENRGNPTL